MFVPEKFAETRVDVMHALMRAHPFATLVLSVNGAPHADHLPLTLVDEPAPNGCLRGHFARANPTWRQLDAATSAIAIFHGPQRYITPAWYPSKRAHGKVVPTWNYAVVHAQGPVRAAEDAEWLHALVSRLTDTHEADAAVPWKVTDAPPDFTDRMLGAIVGVELRIESLTGKWKVSQNRPPADRAGVAAGLTASERPEDHEMARLVDAARD